MRALDTITAAASALAAAKVRTLLTLLGVIVGTACVVSMAAVGEGAQMRIARQAKAFGANVILVNPARARPAGVGRQVHPALCEEDVEAISGLYTVAKAAGSVFGTASVVSGNLNWSTTVNGTTGEHFAVRQWSVGSGRLFTAPEEEAGAKVAVLGQTVAQRLFGDEEPLGGSVRVRDTPFTVIGILSEKGAAPGGGDQDDVVFVPLRAARVRLIGAADATTRGVVAYILASAVSEAQMEIAMDDIRVLLRQRHHVDAGEEDFTVATAASMLEAQRSSARTVALLLGAVAAISLLVGGLSIMNIMLVSATERTKEVGLRMALGARARDVRRQFLSEALALGFAGGVIGVGLGVGGAGAIEALFGWTVDFDPLSEIAAVALATLLAGGFGWYPAVRASSLSPAVALRA